MAAKFLTNIDLVNNQLLNAAVQSLPTAPDSPVVGLVYFNTTNSTLCVWDGTEWVVLGEGLSGPPTGAAGGALSGEYPNPTIDDGSVPLSKLETDPLSRENHTGTQPSSTISDFTTAVQAVAGPVAESAVADLVGAAPEALDTLQELAAALGDDPNFAATITNQLGGLDSQVTTLMGERVKGFVADVPGGSPSATIPVPVGSGDEFVVQVFDKVTKQQVFFDVEVDTTARTVTVRGTETIPAGQYLLRASRAV